MMKFYHGLDVVHYNEGLLGGVAFCECGDTSVVSGELVAAFFRHLCEAKYKDSVEQAKEHKLAEKAANNHWTLDEIMKNEG